MSTGISSAGAHAAGRSSSSSRIRSAAAVTAAHRRTASGSGATRSSAASGVSTRTASRTPSSDRPDAHVAPRDQGQQHRDTSHHHPERLTDPRATRHPSSAASSRRALPCSPARQTGRSCRPPTSPAAPRAARAPGRSTSLVRRPDRAPTVAPAEDTRPRHQRRTEQQPDGKSEADPGVDESHRPPTCRCRRRPRRQTVERPVDTRRRAFRRRSQNRVSTSPDGPSRRCAKGRAARLGDTPRRGGRTTTRKAASCPTSRSLYRATARLMPKNRTATIATVRVSIGGCCGRARDQVRRRPHQGDARRCSGMRRAAIAAPTGLAAGRASSTSQRTFDESDSSTHSGPGATTTVRSVGPAASAGR